MLYEYDKKLAATHKIIVGVDEAGRGPLAGAVYAAAVILDLDNPIEGINDSKKLTEKKREQLYEEIILKAIDYHIGTASVEEIEELNILGATLLAMKRSVEGLKLKADHVLIDGISAPEIAVKYSLVTKGDSTSASIAAASILAKVARDRYLLELDKEYPEYGFAKHKGYGTKLHYEMLDKYGASPQHREAFLRKWRKKQGGQ